MLATKETVEETKARVAQNAAAELAAGNGPAPRLSDLAMLIPRGEIAVIYNVRKTFNPEEDEQLRESIRETNWIDTLLVRPLPAALAVGPHAGKKYQLVAGERRFRVTAELKIDRLPCQVKDLNDQRVLEIQLIENLQRSGLDPVEEAEGYEMLMKTAKYEPKSLAERIHKSTRYVYDRLKLLALPPAGRELLREGRLSLRQAERLSRIPNKELREEALKIVTDPKFRFKREELDWDLRRYPGEILNTEDTLALITEHYMRELKGCPFPTEDAGLLKAAGSCAGCPKRTGNAPHLYGDVQRGDICTDPKCFAAKVEAHRQRAMEEARAKGFKVVSDAEQKKIFDDYRGNSVSYSSPLVKLDEELSYNDVGFGLSKRPKWGPLLEEAKKKKGMEVPVAVAVRPDGAVIKLVEKKLALTAAKAARPELFKKAPSSSGDASYRRDREKRKREEAIGREIFADLTDAICLQIEKQGCEKFAGHLAKFLAAHASENIYGFDWWQRMRTRRKLAEELTPEKYLVSLVKVPAALMGACFEILLLVLQARVGMDWNSEELVDLANGYKIDQAKIEKLARGAFAEREKQAEEKKKSQLAAKKKAGKK